MAEGFMGFVYVITNLLNSKRYFGKKHFTFARTRGPLKGRSRKRKDRVESDWKDYYGSSKDLNLDVDTHGPQNFSREILRLCKSKGEMSYHEAKLILEHDAIIDENFYNHSLRLTVHRVHLGIGKYDRRKEPKKRKENIRITRGEWHTQETREKISETLTGMPFSEDRCKNISAAQVGRIHTDDTKAKMSATRKKQKWYNNGTESIRREEHPGDGWVRGTLTLKNLRWYTNGTENRRVVESPGEGWWLGKTDLLAAGTS
jgi:hypothetical protein